MYLGKTGPSLATSVCRQAKKHGRAGPPVSPSRENHSRRPRAALPPAQRRARRAPGLASGGTGSPQRPRRPGRAVGAPVPGQWRFPNVRLATSARLCPRTSPGELGGRSPQPHEGGKGSGKPRAIGTGSGEPAPVTAGPAERPSGGEQDGTATPSSILAWRIPCTEEPGRLQSMGCRVGHSALLSSRDAGLLEPPERPQGSPASSSVWREDPGL